MSKELKNITVTHAPGRVGLSLFYDDAPCEHVLLALAVAHKLRDKLSEACELASRSNLPGDSVSLSEHVALSISKPTEH